MKSSWKTYRLGDIAEITGGGTPSTKKKNFWNGKIPWLTPKDLRDYNSRYISRGERNISKEGLSKSSAKLLPKDTILLTSRAPIGYVAMAANEVSTNQGFKSITVDTTVADPVFVYYLVKHHVPRLKSLGTGTTFAEISGSVLKQFPINLPPLTEQKAIAEILSSLDDKIELNNQINKNLEALAQAIFKQWFVDFEFPNENGEPYKSSGGSFQNSVFGKIPTGWGSERLASQINVERGLSYKGSGLCSEVEGIPMHNLNSVYEGGGYKYDGIKYYKGEYKDRHLLKPWDIIVTNTEQGHKYLLIGCPAIVPKYFGDTGIFSQHIFKVASKETVTNQFIYYLLLTPYIREQVIGCTNGTTVNMLSKDGLEMPLFALPPKELIDKFSEIVIPVWQKKETIYKENQELSKLRDALVPKLMSGELTVSRGEKTAS